VKALSAGNIATAASGLWPWAWTARFTRTDGQVFRFTSDAQSATISSALYLAAPGFTVSSITCTLGYGVDTLEMTVLTNDEMTRADFLAGRWYACRVEFNQYNWQTPADGFIEWPVYTVSDVTPLQGGFKIELRDLRQYLRQDHSPHRLGSTGDGKCNKDLTSFTHAFTVTSVTSRSIFTCSGLAQAADYFANGQVTFVDGLHGGLPLLVRAHATGGVINLAVPLIADIVVAQTGSIIAGCLKRKAEDCITKFDNVLNFGGQDGVSVTELVGS
jgi:uncharacterized phage protein (TIGR02218 family)